MPASPNTWSSARAAGQRVVAGAAEQQVVAALAEEDVVAGAAEELVVARAAGEHVVAGAAEQLGGGQRAVGFVERDRVVAALAEHLDQGGVGDGRRPPSTGTAPPLMRILSGRVAADRDGVVDVVAGHREQAGSRGKVALIAMVVVLSKVWPRRRCALAVNRVEWGALARSRNA